MTDRRLTKEKTMKSYGLFAFLGMALVAASLQAASDSAYRDQNGKHFREVAGGDLMSHIERYGLRSLATFPVPGGRSTYHTKSSV